MSEENYQLAIIGSGPGGYIAAIRATQLGIKTAIIEKENLGGVCLNWGCIPTKALLASAETYRKIKNAKQYGIDIQLDQVQVQQKQIIKRSRIIAKKLTAGVAFLIKKNKIKLFNATASFIDQNNLLLEQKDAEKQQIKAQNIIIATGAKPAELSFAPADGQNIWNYRHALVAQELPKSIIIIGSGAIGMEFASFFNEFQTKVTVVEMMPQIMPAEDHEIANLAYNSWKKQGIQFFTNARLDKVINNHNMIEAQIIVDGQKNISIKAEKILVAVGVVPNIKGLNLEKIKIKTENRYIKTDQYNRTNIENIFAIGDVTEPPWLAHKASHEGVKVAEYIAGKKPKTKHKPHNIPRCVYSHPQISSIGLTEKQALEQKYQIKIGKFPFSALGKAIAVGESEGIAKVIIEKNTNEIIGVHLIGNEVTEIISSIETAINTEITGEEMINSIFAHPTISEVIHEAFLDAFGRALNI